jgi:hypothetical protein
MISENGIESLSIRRIAFENFEISCAAGNQGRTGYWFGSDDGRIQFMSLDETEAIGPLAVAPSEEAVNGMAFGDNLMAVSTRSDVTFLRAPEPDESHLARTVFHGGAHGLGSTHDGCIIAPLGRRGMLLLNPRKKTAQKVTILKPADQALYIYKVVSLASSDGATILAYAARMGGFGTMPLHGAVLANHGKKLRPVGVDFVDVAALDVEGFPFAVAALGLDCSIHFVSDLRADQVTTTLHLSSISERAYRVLCTEGHVFLLTDKSLYAFKNLAIRFLRREAINDPDARLLRLEAVDVSLGPDRSLLVVMPDSVYRIKIDSVLAGEGPLTGRFRDGWRADVDSKILQTDPDDVSWGQSDELELMEFV